MAYHVRTHVLGTGASHGGASAQAQASGPRPTEGWFLAVSPQGTGAARTARLAYSHSHSHSDTSLANRRGTEEKDEQEKDEQEKENGELGVGEGSIPLVLYDECFSTQERPCDRGLFDPRVDWAAGVGTIRHLPLRLD